MNILLTGGTGFIGRHLCSALVQQGHTLIVLTRSPARAPRHLRKNDAVRLVTSLDELENSEHIDAIINLAGEPIIGKWWTAKRKALLESSRVDTTDALVELVQRLDHKPDVMLSASAVGFYGDAGAAELTEESAAVKRDFTYLLCDAWERSAQKVQREGVRLAILRIGIVLGRDGGLLQQMWKPYRLGLGAQLGTGAQWMSWIHIDDLVGAFLFCLDNNTAQGVFNAVAPHPVTSGNFHKTLAAVCQRPALLRVPETVLQLALREMAVVIVGGQRVLPAHLQKSGFEFRYNDLESALRSFRE